MLMKYILHTTKAEWSNTLNKNLFGQQKYEDSGVCIDR